MNNIEKENRRSYASQLNNIMFMPQIINRKLYFTELCHINILIERRFVSTTVNKHELCPHVLADNICIVTFSLIGIYIYNFKYYFISIYTNLIAELQISQINTLSQPYYMYNMNKHFFIWKLLKHRPNQIDHVYSILDNCSTNIILS